MKEKRPWASAIPVPYELKDNVVEVSYPGFFPGDTNSKSKLHRHDLHLPFLKHSFKGLLQGALISHLISGVYLFMSNISLKKTMCWAKTGSGKLTEFAKYKMLDPIR